MCFRLGSRFAKGRTRGSRHVSHLTRLIVVDGVAVVDLLVVDGVVDVLDVKDDGVFAAKFISRQIFFLILN